MFACHTMTLRNHYCSVYASQCNICMLCCTLLIFFSDFRFTSNTRTQTHTYACVDFFDSFSHASKTHDARLGSPLHYCQSSFSHTCCSSHHTTLSGCLHTVPFAHPNTHAHTQMQKHALHCQVLYAHTHTHTMWWKVPGTSCLLSQLQVC